MLRRELTAVSDGEAEAFFAILTDNAVLLPPNDLPKQGEELHQWMRDFLRNFNVEILSYTEEEIAISGDLAYHRYTLGWTVTPKAGGESVSTYLKGIHILRRESDEDWKIAREIWNADPS